VTVYELITAIAEDRFDPDEGEFTFEQRMSMRAFSCSFADDHPFWLPDDDADVPDTDVTEGALTCLLRIRTAELIDIIPIKNDIQHIIGCELVPAFKLMERQTAQGIPVLPAIPRADGYGLQVHCRYCEAWHYHGFGGGHRSAHCHIVPPRPSYSPGGYILLPVGEDGRLCRFEMSISPNPSLELAT
jgi:hypothetical protein